MSAREEYWSNQDGLVVGFGQRDVSCNSAKKIAVEGAVEELVLDVTDATLLEDTQAVDGNALVNGAEIPAGSLIISATLVVTEAFTSGGAAVLDVGTYDADSGAAVDDDSLIAAEALGNLSLNAVITGAGADVGAVVTQRVKLAATFDTAVYTAGKARVVIKYQPPV
jgi:hypothetical protein